MPNDIGHIKPTINSLVNTIAEGGIKIPPLQRPFVWKPNQIIELLESIYNDYPIGSILCWETSTSLPSERNVAGFQLPSKPESHPFYYVLDGQQRISSLYGVFCSNRTAGEDREEFKVEHKFFDVFFDLEKEIFIHESDKDDASDYLELKGLFEAKQFAKALMNTTDEVKRQRITDLYMKLTNYEIPILVTKKRSLEEVGFIFERVNNTGTKLDIFDLMVALTWTPEFYLQIEFKKIHTILDKKNFKGLKNKILLQCISSILKASCKTKIITSLTGQPIRDNIENLNEALKRAADFLVTQLKVGARGVLPHAHQIIPLSYFFSKVTTASSNQIMSIKKWFWKTSFSDRYSSGTDKNVDDDISLFKDLIENNNFYCFDKLKYSVTSEQLRNTKFSKSNPFSRAFVALLANKNPLDLTNGAHVDIAVALSSFNRREYHHVFSEVFLKDKKVNTDKINSICNFCLLPADSNKKISKQSPSEYFKSLVPVMNYKTILESNLLPIKNDIYKNDDYDNFLIERSGKIIEFIEEQLI